jgi:hypothetical protein
VKGGPVARKLFLARRSLSVASGRLLPVQLLLMLCGRLHLGRPAVQSSITAFQSSLLGLPSPLLCGVQRNRPRGQGHFRIPCLVHEEVQAVACGPVVGSVRPDAALLATPTPARMFCDQCWPMHLLRSRWLARSCPSRFVEGGVRASRLLKITPSEMRPLLLVAGLLALSLAAPAPTLRSHSASTVPNCT